MGTFIRDKAGSGKNFLIVHLGMAMFLPLRRTVVHQLLAVKLAPVYPYTGKGPPGTFNAGRPPPAAALAQSSSLAGPLQATAELLSTSWPVRPPCGARPAASAGRSRAQGVRPQNTETRTHSPSSCSLRSGRMRRRRMHCGVDRRTPLENSGSG